LAKELEFVVEGFTEVERNTKDRIQGMFSRGRNGLYEAAERILERSNDKVPVKTGSLLKSGTIHVDYSDNREPAVAVSYGNEEVRYAAIVHEKPIQHVTGEAKFLEHAVQEVQSEVARIIARRITFS
jgi:hypothetical protein